MISTLISILIFFPISFLVYGISERTNVTHQSRVGKGATFPGFLYQLWVDSWSELVASRAWKSWAVLVLQLSLVFFLEYNFVTVFLIYLALNSLVLVTASPLNNEVEARINADRSQVFFLIGSLLGVLSAMSVFIQNEWTPLHLVFVPLFLVAGMILFLEYPFQSGVREQSWLQSARFYGWCMVATHLFLKGNLFILDGHLKSAVLFVACRLLGRYFPAYSKQDLFRISLVYLLPMAIALWLFSAIIFGLVSYGGSHA